MTQYVPFNSYARLHLYTSQHSTFNMLQGYFLKNRTTFDLEDKLLPVSNMSSSGLKKIIKSLKIIILYTLKIVSENIYPIILFFDTKINVMSYNGM